MHPYNKIMRRFQKILDQNCTLFKNTYYKSHKSSFVPKKDFEVGEDLRSYLRSIEKKFYRKTPGPKDLTSRIFDLDP